jgi:transposase-like protein
MPYLKTGALYMRLPPKLIIETLRKNCGAIRKTARELGISPATVLNWKRKARSVISPNYYRIHTKRNSTKPKKVRKTTLTLPEQQKLLSLRNEYGYGAEKLESLSETNVHYNTIHRFLKSKNMVMYRLHRHKIYHQETINFSSLQVPTV